MEQLHLDDHRYESKIAEKINRHYAFHSQMSYVSYPGRISLKKSSEREKGNSSIIVLIYFSHHMIINT